MSNGAESFTFFGSKESANFLLVRIFYEQLAGMVKVGVLCFWLELRPAKTLY
jgi:hypothetical protein